MVTIPGKRARSIRRFRSDLAAEVGHPDLARSALVLGIGILGRAVMHAWRLGDMTDFEAVRFVDQITVQLLEDLAAADAAR